MTEPSRTVLVVEDDPGFGPLLVQVLGDAGHRARLAATGDAAIEACAELVPDVLFIDIDLPGTTGWALLDALEQRGIEARRVVVSSGSMDAVNRHRPGVFVLPKPFPIQSLLRLVGGDEAPAFPEI